MFAGNAFGWAYPGQRSAAIVASGGGPVAATFSSTGTGTSTFTAKPTAITPRAPVLDDFNTGASQNLTARTGWGATEFWSGDPTLATNSTPNATATVASGFKGNYWSGSLTDCEVGIEIGTAAGTFYLYTRGSGQGTGTPSAYNLEWAATGAWFVQKYTSGSPSGAIISGTQALGAGDKILLRSVSTRHEVWHKPAGSTWTRLGYFHDSTFTSGVIALELNAGGGTVDTFLGGALAPLPSNVLWRATHETRDYYDEWETTSEGDWMGGHADSGGTTVIDTAHAHTGSYALKMTTTATFGGPDVGTRNFRIADVRGETLPAEAEYEAWFYFDQNYDPDQWWNIMQWKTRTGASTSDPDWSVNVYHDGTGMRLYLYDYHRAGPFGDSGPGSLAANTWHKLTVQYRFHATNGLIRVWLNGVLWYDESGVATEGASPYLTFGHERQWSINNYTNGNNPATSNIWADDAEIRVAPAARTATFASTGTGASTFTANKKRNTTFASTGSGTTTFGVDHTKQASFASTGSGTSTFTLAARRKATLASTGTGTSTFTANKLRRATFSSTGTGTTAFTGSWYATAPNQAVLDSFNTGPNQALTSRTAIGWSSGIPLLSYSSLVTNATPTSAKGPGTLNANLWGSSFAADEEVWITVATLISSRLTVMLRRTGTASNFNSYALEVSSAGNWEIAKYIGGAGGSTVLLLSSGLQTIAVGDSIGVTVTGDIITTWHKPSAGSWTKKQQIRDTSISGSGSLVIITGDATTAIDSFAGGDHSLSGLRELTISSTGTGTSSFALASIRKGAFTSAGSSTTSFVGATRRPVTVSSTGTGTSTFAANKLRPAAFSSTGAGTSTFGTSGSIRNIVFAESFLLFPDDVLLPDDTLYPTVGGRGTTSFTPNTLRNRTFASNGVGDSDFGLVGIHGLAFSSSGTSTSAFAATRRRAVAFTSTGTSSSAFGNASLRQVTMQEAPAILPGDPINPADTIYPGGDVGGVSSSTFTLTAFIGHAASFASTGSGTTTFTLAVRRAVSFASTGSGTSVFGAGRTGQTTFTSTGSSTSVFALAALRPATFTSAGTGASTFTRSAQHYLTFTSAGTGTSAFTVARTFFSPGSGTSLFVLHALRKAALSSTGTGGSSFTLKSLRGATFTSNGVGASTFTLLTPIHLTIASDGVGTSTFTYWVKRQVTFTSTGAATSTWTLTGLGPSFTPPGGGGYGAVMSDAFFRRYKPTLRRQKMRA